MSARRTIRRILHSSAFVTLALVLASCANDDRQSALNPAGRIARDQHQLFQPVFWIATAIFFIVEILALYIIVKFRDRGQPDEPKQVHGNTKLEFTWTLIPALILLGIAIPTVATIFELAEKPKGDVVNVNVVGHQWWWEYRYLDVDPALVTANELVIPTGKPVFLTLNSADVIHSFWVPRLAGKQDVVPGRTNTLILEADEPGIYEGQCAEFCALSHAKMRLRVIAKSPADFDRWLRDQQRDAQKPTSPDAERGQQLFTVNCGACHSVAGTDAQGQVGPNLTHFADRTTFGVPGTMETNLDNLIAWIKAPRDIKPGVLMPNFAGTLTDEEIRAIAQYLLTLK